MEASWLRSLVRGSRVRVTSGAHVDVGDVTLTQFRCTGSRVDVRPSYGSIGVCV